MRSRYRVAETDRAHVVTSTIVEWLPVFTSAACCDIIVRSLAHCREHKGLRVYAWVRGHQTVRAIIGSFEVLKSLADFESATPTLQAHAEEKHASGNGHDQEQKSDTDGHLPLKLGLSYTINLVLPKTDDVAVFNAIFKALRENLLRK